MIKLTDSLTTPLRRSRRGLIQTTAVVIGSGFGGAVAAARLSSRLGGDVLVLERGREVLPGGFPATLAGLLAEVRSHDHPLGIFDMRMFRDVDVLVANALGGGSQLYAGVTLPPEPAVFEGRDRDGRRTWPAGVNAGALTGHYITVRQMLGVEPWLDAGDARTTGPATPFELMTGSPAAADAAWPSASARTDAFGRLPAQRPALAKSDPIRVWAKDHGVTVYRPPLAINLTLTPDGRVNDQGVERRLCQQCGDCVTGCNFGSKNTLSVNYLALAFSNGAQIATQTEVVGLRPGGLRRWVLTVMQRGLDRSRPPTRLEVHADLVVLAAGALGSTELLLRAAADGLELSGALGSRMSLNGDDWAVTVDGRQPLDSVMTGEVNAPGPVITLSARVQGERGDVTLVQDATIPSMLARAMPRGIGMLLQGAGGRSHPLRWLEHSAPWLVMGHDGARGSAGLDSERHLRMTWPDVMDDPSVETRDRILAELADVQRARMIRPPRAWGHRSARAAITVHALGGARMADSPRDGVVDEFGRVFRPDRGVHPGLYVLDGSVCSSALGANPSLGIAALAERGIAEVMATDLGLPAGEAAVLGRM